MTQTLCHIPTQTPARPTLATLRNSHPTRLPSNYSLGTSWLPGLARAPGNGTVNQTEKIPRARGVYVLSGARKEGR